MFVRMNSGLGDDQTGLMINGQNLGLLEDVVSGAGKRARTKGPPAQGAGAAGNPQPLPAESPLIVHWGPALAARRLCAGGSSQAGLEQRLMTAFVEKAAETPVQWHANDAEMPRTRDQQLAAARMARTVRIDMPDCHPVRFPGGWSACHSYNVKHFAPAVLLNVETKFPRALAALPLARVQDWCPDECNHMEGLGDLSGREVQVKFSTTPLLLSCWACLLGSVRPKEGLQKVLRATDEALWVPVMEYELDLDSPSEHDNKEDRFPPGPHVIAESVM